MEKEDCKYYQLNGGCILTADNGFCELCIMEQYSFIKQCRNFEPQNMTFKED